MLDRLTSMQAFMAVVRTGGFARAGTELGLSPAMITKHVKALEEHLGMRLLNRTTRAVRLTEAGTRYHAELGELLAQLGEIEQRLSAETRGARGVLSVAAPPSFGARFIAPLVADFMRAEPAVRVRLTLTDREVDLIEEGIDVAIRVRELEASNLIARRLTEVRLHVCASAGYLARHGHPAQPDDLARHNCLLFAEQPAFMAGEWRFNAAGEVRAIRVAGDFVSNASEALRQLAVRGQGIVRLPHYIVADDLASGHLIAVLEDYAPARRPVHALYAHRDHQPGKLRAFVDFAVRAFARESSFDNEST